MKKTAMIRARIDPAIKQEAESIFAKIGLNASEAIGLFYHQVKLKNGLPFEIRLFPTGRSSEVAHYAQTALIRQAQRMSPQERLNAFSNHCYLLRKLEDAGTPIHSKRER